MSKRKYKTPQEAYLGKLEANKRWRLRHPEQWRRIQARNYQRRKARLAA
jgi:hypothetical protein